MKPIIAIDGPSGVGKSTAAFRVAQQLGFTLVDTGAFYRCLALLAKRTQVDEDNAIALALLARNMPIRFEIHDGRNRVYLDGEDVTVSIRAPDVSQLASKVSAHAKVREALLACQRQMAESGGVVLEGRDIGTVVFPKADVKIFLTACPEQRARWRCNELIAQGVSVTYEQTLAEMIERDQRDSSRTVAPLKAAPDAHEVDTGLYSMDGLVTKLLSVISLKM